MQPEFQPQDQQPIPQQPVQPVQPMTQSMNTSNTNNTKASPMSKRKKIVLTIGGIVAFAMLAHIVPIKSSGNVCGEGTDYRIISGELDDFTKKTKANEYWENNYIGCATYEHPNSDDNLYIW